MHQPVRPNHRDHDIRVLCTHAFDQTSSGASRICGSPALRGESFCYYHHPARKVASNRDTYRARCRNRRIARQTFNLPLPTSRRELQHSLNQIIALIAANQIDLRRANLLLFALDAAGRNLIE